MSINAENKDLKISSRAYSEAKQNMIFCKLGTKLSEETKKKISESKKANPCDY
jgi:hypothetical protein